MTTLSQNLMGEEEEEENNGYSCTTQTLFAGQSCALLLCVDTHSGLLLAATLLAYTVREPSCSAAALLRRHMARHRLTAVRRQQGDVPRPTGTKWSAFAKLLPRRSSVLCALLLLLPALSLTGEVEALDGSYATDALVELAPVDTEEVGGAVDTVAGGSAGVAVAVAVAATAAGVGSSEEAAAAAAAAPEVVTG